MGWVLTSLAVALVIAFGGGAALACFRRYCVGWQWGTRNFWSICEEWRQRLSWLWAPREEKVGLVKAQHPTPQTIPGLYRQAGHNSDSDFRLDSQGAFIRFEPVDNYLHPPLSTASSGIPPQPLRPAPQPRPTARPRPSPLQTTSTLDYLRMQESGPYPLTPPPPPQTTSGTESSLHRNQLSRTIGPSIFHFQSQVPKSYGLLGPSTVDHSDFRMEEELADTMTENIQLMPFITQNLLESRLARREEEFENLEKSIDRRKEGYDTTVRCNPYRGFEEDIETSRIRYRVHGVPVNNLEEGGDTEEEEEDATSYGSYDIIQRSRVMRPHMRNDGISLAENTFGMRNSGNSMSQGIAESIYGHDAFRLPAKTLQAAQSLGNDLDHITNAAAAAAAAAAVSEGIEMTPLRSSSLQEDISLSYFFRELQGHPRVSQYNQSLPALPLYDSGIDEMPLRQERQNELYGRDRRLDLRGQFACSPVPPPPAPPDNPFADGIGIEKNNSTASGGIERIFSALRSATSQSYIGASEFFNSVLSPPQQQVQRFAFPPTLLKESGSNRLQDDGDQRIYSDSERDILGLDGSKRSSDLYSAELNLEAHRTAQEVCNSLQHPPSSPLLVNEHNQDTYDFMSDSTFMRKPEVKLEKYSVIQNSSWNNTMNNEDVQFSHQEILNSLEQQCRKSTEKLNSMPDYTELENNSEPIKRRNSQEFHAALEELQFKRRLSQSLDEAYLSSFTLNDISPGSRRSSQGLELLETASNDSNLKRAISCESVCSDTSVVPNDLKDVPVVGYICVGIERWNSHNGESLGDLTVSILEARDLITADGMPAEHTFAKVCLLPDTDTHVRTKLYRGSPSPSYQGKFCISGSVTARTLLIEVFSDDSASGAGVSLIGEATLRLPAPKSQATTWLPLSKTGVLIPQLGELMFSLSYSPTAERLKLVVVKANNLRATKGLNGDFFVKVYLLQNKKKIYKKRTSVKKGEKNPIFNEAIIFNVPAHMLENIDVRLTVAEVNNEQGATGKPYIVGHIIVGPSTTGIALLHWKEMLISLRRPVSRWHPLRK